ncbi:hypothetical protein R8Z57_11110 [Microbacterium sp. M3]|uniref:Fis family transcriptional regulator n=1 Tax=Microbacterium arthrosphaerae TaxID=792652 RepID=A0ABU4H5Z9_9MICO|nr:MULTISPECIES: hypothetical protein [Microbacterium]MDW4573319.1 hypothetical protein [Microbacterium arthrosphaerae]MDW7607174.1 hypothetical protein [Microbacterium sp. M3]
MRWDRFFDDLEDQLASEWEAERAALDTEAERLRLSRVRLAERLSLLAGRDAQPGVVVSMDLSDGATLRATVTGVGADWAALAPADGPAGAVIVPFASIVAIGMPHADLLRTARPTAPRSPLADRLTFGFVLRDLVRRRAGVAVHLTAGRVLTGTIDRAGADHLDLALHDPGAPRRADAVAGHRIVPFAAVAWIRADEAPALP